MAKRTRRSCLGTILVTIGSSLTIVCLGILGISVLEHTRRNHLGTKIPYQEVRIEQEKFAEKFYYESLPEKDKIIYQEILQGLLDGEKEVYIHSGDAEKNNLLFEFVLNDYPEIFWCDGKGQTTVFKKGEESYSVLAPEYQYEGNEREAKTQEIENVVDAFLNEAPVNGTEYEKIKYVYEYVIHHTVYNAAASDSQNIVSSLVNGESVCAGYARTTQYLLEKMNVFCTYVTGTATRPGADESVPHAWNLVSCSGDYYYVDTTWGDPIYLEERDSNMVYDYLCINDDELFRTHTADDVISLPACTSVDYNYYAINGMYFTEFNKDAIFEKMKESIHHKQNEIVFKFADEAVYAEAKDAILSELMKDAASYLGRLYQLSRVEYSYKDEAILNKITIYWKYE